MVGITHAMKRIPRIKFPLRHPKPSSGSETKPQPASVAGDAHSFSLGSKVLAAPANAAVGGKASLQPKRTPVSDKEIEAILLVCAVTDIIDHGRGSNLTNDHTIV